jgi:predicted nucleotide-binding protein (sugar kinase/HSP70/actin superfamily)
VAHLRSNYYISVLAECKELIEREVHVDFTRPKPICKVTGEFWAQTTEGDGNYHMFRFMESQGAEVLIEPVTTWLNYMLAQERSKLIDQEGLDATPGLRGWLASEFAYRRKRFRLAVGSALLNREYDRIRRTLGGTTHAQVCQLELQRMGDPYYSRKSDGGEGHLEVAKNIYYSNKNLAHMVMSLKPFGCMPSSQSDGAQAAVTSHFSHMIYIPIETSGEGDVNAHSRAQMALGEAKIRCKEEFKTCVAETGYSIEQIRAYCNEHPETQNPFLHIPGREGVIGRAANFVGYIAEKMKRDGWEG